MAKYIEGQHIGNLQKTKLVFWTGGNEPTQKVNAWTYDIVLTNLKLLYLLSGKVIASASYFFESPITQQVTDTLKSFFEEGDIMYFFDEDLESPTDHAEKKIAKSPKGLSAYRDKKTVLNNAKKLETLGNNLLRRPPLSISNKMVELWIDEVLSTNNNSIGASIAKEVSHYEKQNVIKKKLVDFAKNREKDFVWDYIKPILVNFGLKNPHFHKMIQGKLAQMYALATANVLGVELDEKLNYNLIDKNSKYDTSLFAVCLKQLGIYQLILQLDNSDLKQLKNSLDFEIFRTFYFNMIEDCQYQSNNVGKSIDTFRTIENEKQNNITKKDFVNKFIELNKLCNYPRRNFRQRLDEIKMNLETFNTRTGIVTNFVSLVQSKQVEYKNQNNNKTFKDFIMGILFNRKVKSKRFYDVKSRTLDITGLKVDIPQKFDIGLGAFKLDTKYQEASEKLQTLDLLQYGLSNDINAISDQNQRDLMLTKIIETKTQMLEVIMRLNE